MDDPSRSRVGTCHHCRRILHAQAHDRAAHRQGSADPRRLHESDRRWSVRLDVERSARDSVGAISIAAVGQRCRAAYKSALSKASERSEDHSRIGTTTGQRLGVKAYLAGSIASLGTSYVIQINAVNVATGEVFAREQVTSPDKTGVLQAVSQAATAMRSRLGESMASIQKLTTPYTNVTTASLQAFHAFSLAEDEHRVGHDFPQAASLYQQAIELDPAFAMGYARLGVAYGNVGSISKALENLKKAYDLRERVTERERMYIESQYALQQYDMPKAIDSYKLFVATYPRDAAAWNNLASAYAGIGDLQQAAQDFVKTWEIAKWDNV